MENTRIKFPKVCFWNHDVKRILFINPEDFREEDFLKAIGLEKTPLRKSFGIVDREEILKRQALIKFFTDNPTVAQQLCDMEMTNANLPFDSLSFLRYYSPEKTENPFVELIDELKDVISMGSVPDEIEKFVGFMSDARDQIHSLETDMVRRIGNEVQKASLIEGHVEMKVHKHRDDVSVVQSKVFGYKKYSYGLANYVEQDIPRWCRKMGIKRFAGFIVDKINERKKRFYYSPLILSGDAPREIISAIESFLKKKIAESEENGQNFCFPVEDMSDEISIMFMFRYDDCGLNIEMIDLTASYRDDDSLIARIKKGGKHDGYIETEFPGYTKGELKEIREKNTQFNLGVVERKQRLLSAKIMSMLDESMDLIRGIKIPSYDADVRFKWFSVKKLYEQEDIAGIVQNILAYREFFKNNLNVLREVASVSLILSKKAQEFGVDIDFSEILPDRQHLISFDSLVPVHLVSHGVNAQDVVPLMCLPNINGQIIAFTGQNAGGKSTAKEAIVNVVYLAQSGLPSFGKGVRLNVKKQIGMVFLERGSGSTCELLLRKAKRLLESLESVDPCQSLLILDEVGTGTQEVDGFDFGKRLLSKLAGSKSSVIFSTQITELANFAKKTLGTECFNFDLNHHIVPGIGQGGINKLMEEVGIDKLL